MNMPTIYMIFAWFFCFHLLFNKGNNKITEQNRQMSISVPSRRSRNRKIYQIHKVLVRLRRNSNNIIVTTYDLIYLSRFK